MTATQLLIVLAALWALVGLATATVMARRGHAGFTWWLLGALLGPVAVVLAADAVRREPAGRVRVRRAGAPVDGAVDVLVGIDGSAASIAALDHAVTLLGPRLRRLTLATVVSFEADEDPRDWDEEREATGALELAASRAVDHDPETVVLAGRPAEALGAHARSGGYHLLVVGARGRGASRAVLGSVASALARGAGIPVLIAEGAGAGQRETTYTAATSPT